MSYLKRPSTYVIGAVAIGVYIFVWPMVSGMFMAKSAPPSS